MKRSTCEVVVVGAGPAGCEAARRLAAAGRDVVLADENPGPREEVVCTGIVGEEAFRRLDLPTGAVVDTLPAARFVSPGGLEVTYRPDAPLARVVDRTRFDAALARRAETAGARLRRGWAARAVERDETGITVRFERGNEAGDGPGDVPEEIRLEARALVLATGHQRWLHEAAGLGTPDRYVHGVHADLSFRGAEAAELFFGNDLAPGFFGWAVPYGEGTARLGVLVPQGGRRHFFRLLGHPEIRDRVEVPPIEGAVPSHVPWLHSRGIVQGAVRPSISDRVVAVGEAAGQVKTTTAGGIYYGLRGAGMAAEVLVEALADDRLDAGRLSAYEEAWTARLGPEIEAGLDLQDAAREMSDQEIDRVFSALQADLGATLRALVEFDWHRPALRVLFEHPRLRRHLEDATSVAGISPLSMVG